ncbi:hypothetical protein GX586_14690 [bacterium]|nr:hypothetical protein [bacterium]
MNRQTRHHLGWAAAAVIALGAVLLAYCNTFGASWHFDDFRCIVEYDYEHATLRSLYGFAPGRFLGFLTFWLNYLVSGYRVASWHAVNLAVHCINAALVFMVAQRVFLASGRGAATHDERRFAAGAAWVIALLFAVHPVQTQAVTYIVQRLELLGTTWALVALLLGIACVEAGTWSGRVAAGAGAFMALALGSVTKETIAVAPALLCVYLVLFTFRTARSRVAAVAVCGVLGLAAAAAVLMKVHALTLWPRVTYNAAPFAELWHDAPPPLQYYATQCRVLLLYLRLCVFPYGQHVEHDIAPSGSFGDPAVLAALAIQACVLAVAAAMARRRPAVLFGVLWFYLFLAPSSVMPNGVFEHRVYGALAGVLIAVFVPLGRDVLFLPARERRIAGGIALGVSLSLALCFIALSFLRNAVWQSDLTLWADAVEKSPRNYRANANLGYALMNAGELDAARTHLERSFELNSNVHLVANNLGILEYEAGDHARSELYFLHALRLKPGDPMVEANLGALYLEMARRATNAVLLAEATNLLLRASTVEALGTLGAHQLAMREWAGATASFSRIALRHPRAGADAWAGWCAALISLGDAAAARETALRGLRHFPGHQTLERIAAFDSPAATNTARSAP